MESVPRDETVNQLITGRYCSVWGSKPSNTSRIMAKQGLAVQHYDAPTHTALPVKQFWPLKTCPWKPTPFNRPILTLVISSGFRKWKHSYKGVVSRICTKLGAIADWCTRDSKKPVPGVLPEVAITLDPLHKLGRGLLRTETKSITKVGAYFVNDSVRELLNTPSYAWNLQGYKHCTAAQCDYKTHRLPTTQNITNGCRRDGGRPVVGGSPLLYSVRLTSLPSLRVQNLEDEQKWFVRLGETCPSAFTFRHFRRPHDNYPTSPRHSIGQHAMRIKKSATRCSRSTRVQSMIMKLHFLNSLTRVLPVVFHEFPYATRTTNGRARNITATIT